MLKDSQKQIAQTLKDDPDEAFDSEQNMSLYRKLSYAFNVRAKAAKRLATMIDDISGPLIVCGDFNDVPGSYAWRTIKATGLEDAYVKAGLGPMVTFNANTLFFHIDQVMYRPDCGMRAYEIKRGNLRSSDHYPVITYFAVNPDELN